MPSFAIKTGSLPSTLAAQAIPYGKRAEFNLEVPSGFRWCFIGYKHNKESIQQAEKLGTPLPQNFVLPIPATFDVPEAWDSFTTALALDYQDKLIHDVADSKATVNPLDWDAVIKDYFDTSRERSTPSLADVEKWFDEVWSIAYIMRVEQRNQQALASPTKEHVQTKAETDRIINAYKAYFRQIAKKSCPLSENIIRSVRQSTTKLIELTFLDSDEIVEFLLERINDHLKQHEAEVVDPGV